MSPPLLLLPLTWERYGYSLEDARKTCAKTDLSYIWQLALMLISGEYEPEAAVSGVKPTFQSPFTFSFGLRKTVTDAYLSGVWARLSRHHPKRKAPVEGPEASVLCYESKHHCPFLPRVVLSNDAWRRLRAWVPSRYPSFLWRVHYPGLFRFRGVDLVPVSCEQNVRLCLVRVVRESVFASMPVHPKRCVVTLPIVVEVGPRAERYVLTEELCLAWATANAPGASLQEFQNEASPPKKRRLLLSST